VGELAEYRLKSGSSPVEGPSAEDVQFAADVIENRVIAYGPAQYRVEVTPTSTILVSLPRMIDSSDLRGLISATGNIEFVPVPAGPFVQPGDPRPAGEALFGREGIADVQPGTDAANRPAVDIGLAPPASAVFDEYAEAHFSQQIAIVLDGTVISAPTLMATSFGGRLQIQGESGDATQARLLTLLRYPALPGEMEEVSLEAVSPRTGCAP
jgi:preprotein translocase subunit SecD